MLLVFPAGSSSLIGNMVVSGAPVFANLTVIVHNLDKTVGKLILHFYTQDPFGFSRQVTSAVVMLREATFDKQVRYLYG